MQAIIYEEYGSPDVLALMEVDQPILADDEVLIKMQAASLNASDLEFLTAHPAYVRMWGLFKPKNKILASDIAGIVEAVGSKVTLFKSGDAVMGDVFERWGGLAEYVCAPEKALIKKPDTMTFEEAAAFPQAAVVALQGLRYKGAVQPGQKVLINGAGGGAGSFAIQLAKLQGAEVTGVDNRHKLELMRSLGADQVIDYTREDFTTNGQRYDKILDLVAKHPIAHYKRALKPCGVYAMVGGSVPQLLKTLTLGTLVSLTTKKSIGLLMHRPNTADLTYMAELHAAGKMVAAIDKQYPLSETAEAFRYLASGKACGKVVIRMG